MEIIKNYIVGKQHEYEKGSDAYNLLKQLEIIIPNIIKEQLSIHSPKNDRDVPICPNCGGHHCIYFTKHCTKCNSTFINKNS
jgi:hypothetical protein